MDPLATGIYDGLKARREAQRADATPLTHYGTFEAIMFDEWNRLINSLFSNSSRLITTDNRPQMMDFHARIQGYTAGELRRAIGRESRRRFPDWRNLEGHLLEIQHERRQDTPETEEDGPWKGWRSDISGVVPFLFHPADHSPFACHVCESDPHDAHASHFYDRAIDLIRTGRHGVYRTNTGRVDMRRFLAPYAFARSRMANRCNPTPDRRLNQARWGARLMRNRPDAERREAAERWAAALGVEPEEIMQRPEKGPLS